MPKKVLTVAPARTVLEQQIRERLLTFEEFVEFAVNFAFEHNEPGTLSVRHLQRLVSGRCKSVRPATARLLERIFGMTIGELLSPPGVFRSNSGAHPLRVAIAVVLRGEEVLVVRRRSAGADGISWQFPAGMMKPGVPAEMTAVRETLGETDVHCVVRGELGSRLHPATKVLCDYLLCDYVAGEARNVDAFENVDVAWVTKSKLGGFIPAEQIYRPVLEALELAAAN
ncbi:NUDIX hydrolase [Lentzea atacamensis]|nr:NUDIX hydrolase [Lentzea atacamensis]